MGYLERVFPNNSNTIIPKINDETPFQSLNDKITSYLFSFLDRNTLQNSAKTCKTFKAIISDRNGISALFEVSKNISAGRCSSFTLPEYGTFCIVQNHLTFITQTGHLINSKDGTTKYLGPPMNFYRFQKLKDYVITITDENKTSIIELRDPHTLEIIKKFSISGTILEIFSSNHILFATLKKENNQIDVGVWDIEKSIAIVILKNVCVTDFRGSGIDTITIWNDNIRLISGSWKEEIWYNLNGDQIVPDTQFLSRHNNQSLIEKNGDLTVFQDRSESHFFFSIYRNDQLILEAKDDRVISDITHYTISESLIVLVRNRRIFEIWDRKSLSLLSQTITDTDTKFRTEIADVQHSISENVDLKGPENVDLEGKIHQFYLLHDKTFLIVFDKEFEVWDLQSNIKDLKKSTKFDGDLVKHSFDGTQLIAYTTQLIAYTTESSVKQYEIYDYKIYDFLDLTPFKARQHKPKNPQLIPNPVGLANNNLSDPLQDRKQVIENLLNQKYSDATFSLNLHYDHYCIFQNKILLLKEDYEYFINPSKRTSTYLSSSVKLTFFKMQASESYVFLIGRGQHAKYIEVRDPDSFQLIGELLTRENIHEIFSEKNILCAITSSDKNNFDLEVWDIKNNVMKYVIKAISESELHITNIEFINDKIHLIFSDKYLDRWYNLKGEEVSEEHAKKETFKEKQGKISVFQSTKNGCDHFFKFYQPINGVEGEFLESNITHYHFVSSECIAYIIKNRSFRLRNPKEMGICLDLDFDVKGFYSLNSTTFMFVFENGFQVRQVRDVSFFLEPKTLSIDSCRYIDHSFDGKQLTLILENIYNKKIFCKIWDFYDLTKIDLTKIELNNLILKEKEPSMPPPLVKTTQAFSQSANNNFHRSPSSFANGLAPSVRPVNIPPARPKESSVNSNSQQIPRLNSNSQQIPRHQINHQRIGQSVQRNPTGKTSTAHSFLKKISLSFSFVIRGTERISLRGLKFCRDYFSKVATSLFKSIARLFDT